MSSNPTAVEQILSEPLITLSQAAQLVPAVNGRKPHVATLYRWATRGIKGVILESAFVGGVRVTSVEAIQRFLNRLLQKPAPTRSPDKDCEGTAQSDVEHKDDGNREYRPFF